MLSIFDLLDLRPAAGDRQYRFVATGALCTPFGFLYGGSGIAASIEAAERATQRPLQWITTQFLGSPIPGETVDLDVRIPVHGKVTTQAQVVATVEGRVVFTSVCAHTERPGGDQAAFVEMPDVPTPEECSEMSEPFTQGAAGSFFDHLERRVASGSFALHAVDDPQRGTLGLWCRMPGREIGSPATQSFVADIVPLGICAALGVMPGGTSLDNTMRIVDPAPTEWVLLEIVPEGYHRSIGHGTVRLWSADARLLGIAQQTCIIRTSHHERR